jgi:hypothetical protein
VPGQQGPAQLMRRAGDGSFGGSSHGSGMGKPNAIDVKHGDRFRRPGSVRKPPG